MGPPDFLLDPQTSQIKVKSMWGQVFTFVRQTTTQIKSKGFPGDSGCSALHPFHAFIRPSRSHHPHILPPGSMV
jgi:hypothetical protein